MSDVSPDAVLGALLGTRAAPLERICDLVCEGAKLALQRRELAVEVAHQRLGVLLLLPAPLQALPGLTLGPERPLDQLLVHGA